MHPAARRKAHRHRVLRRWLIAIGVCLLAAGCSGRSTTTGAETQAPTTSEAPATSSPLTAPTTDEPELDSGGGDDAGDLTAYLDQLATSDFSGVVLVDDGGDTITRAYGLADRESGIPIRDDSVFDIGSITKQFTAAAILRLEMDGLVSVDEPVSTYVDGLPPATGAVTLHQLLTHSAGLPGSLGRDYEPVGRAEMVQLIADTELLDPPGAAYTYSNPGYSLLAMVIEEVTGQSYEQYLHDALFVPAGMADTGYQLPLWDRERVAVGYTDADERFGKPDELAWDDDGPYWHLRGNGGILSTAADMLAWHRALAGDELLDESAKEKLFNPHIEEGPGARTYYGYGWSIVPLAEDRTLVAHDGGNGVFFANFLRFVDDDLTIFVATNAAGDVAEAVPLELADLVLGTDLADSTGGDDPCGFGQWSPEDLPPGETIDALPSTGPGTVAALFLAVLGGDSERRAELAELVDPALAGDATTEEITAEIELLEAELAGHELVQTIQSSPTSFHFLLRLPDDTTLVSVGTADGEPHAITCVGVSYS